MPSRTPSDRPWSSMTVVNLAVGLLGLALFLWMLRRAGLGAILEQVQRLGWGGFAGILGLSGIRFVARSAAWTRAVEPPARLPFGSALAASLMSEPVANLTPLSTLLSEPAKAVFVRDRIALAPSFAALVIENLFYSASVALMITGGAAAFLVAFDMPASLRLMSLVAIGAMAAVLLAAALLLGSRARPVSRVAGWLASRAGFFGWLASRLERIQRFESRVAGFSGRHPGRVLGVLGFEGLFHLAGVAEVYLTLTLVGAAPSLLVALIFESTGRFVNVVFRFVPMRVGVDEAGAVLLAGSLGVLPAAAVTLALARKARTLSWTAVGLVVLVARGVSMRQAMADAEQARAARPQP